MGTQKPAYAGEVGGVLDGEFVDHVCDGAEVEGRLRWTELLDFVVPSADEGLVVTEIEAAVKPRRRGHIHTVANRETDGNVETAQSADHVFNSRYDFWFGKEGAIGLQVGWEVITHH